MLIPSFLVGVKVANRLANIRHIAATLSKVYIRLTNFLNGVELA